MIKQRSDRQLFQRTLWAGGLTAATVLSTFVLDCATPFSALIVLAVLFLPRKDALLLIAGNFLINQAIGFGFLHWPLTLSCFLGGASVAAGCAVSTGVAMAVGRGLRGHTTTRAIGAFLAAFLGFEATIAAFSGFRSHEAADLQTYLYILYLNGLAFTALLGLQGVAASFGFAGQPLASPKVAAGTP